MSQSSKQKIFRQQMAAMLQNKIDAKQREYDAAVMAELRKQVLARPGASKIPAEVDALKFGDSPLTPEQRKIISDMRVALTPMNMHQQMAKAEAEIDRLTAERDAARAEVKGLRNAVWSAYSDLHAHLYVATNMEGSRLFSAYETLRTNYTAIRAALGSEVGE